MKKQNLSSLIAVLIFAGAAVAQAQTVTQYGPNPAATLGSAGNFANGYWFVGYSPQDHSNGGAGSPKYDLYNYLILNGVDPSTMWAPSAAAGMNVSYPGLYWAYDGQTIMYGDEYVHSAPAQYGVAGADSNPNGPMAEFFWGSNGLVCPDPSNAGQQIPAGALPSGAVSPPNANANPGPAPCNGTQPPGSGTPPNTTTPPNTPPPAGSNPNAAADAINLANVKILNAPDVTNWPVTAQITSLQVESQGINVFFTKRDGPGSWPLVSTDGGATPPTPQGNFEYTLWIVEKISGQWYASGGQLYWQSVAADGKTSVPLFLGGAPSTNPGNEFYDPNRWGPMANHDPAPGESVGYFVTSGNARNNQGPFGPSERSNIVMITYPSDSGLDTAYPLSTTTASTTPGASGYTAPTETLTTTGQGTTAVKGRSTQAKAITTP